MPIPEWVIQILSGVTGSSITILALLYIFITNPDKITEWGNIFLKIIAYRSKKAERKYMASDIKLKIDKERKNMGVQGDVLSYGIEIIWTEEEKVEIDLIENKVVLMMNNHRSQSKNLAHAVSLYVPRALLPKARNYVYPNIMIGLDYIIGSNFVKSNSVALEYFQEREIKKHNDVVLKILDLMEIMNSSGRLSRIYINELKSLGILYPSKPSKIYYEETIKLLKEINSFETIESGEELKGRGIFKGDFFNVCIVPVGRAALLEVSGLEKHLDFIGNQINAGIKHFYIVSIRGSNDAKDLTKLACLQYNLTMIYEDSYKGIFRGKMTNMFCTLCIVED